jgi:hypothetical protein
VHQAFDALFDFHECTVVGQVGDLAEQAGALRVATRQTGPRIVAQLLHAQGDAVLLLIVLEDLGGDLLANRQHFRRVTHTTPCQVGDVQQAVDATQINERTVVGDVLDDTGDDGAFLQGFHQLGALFAHRGFDHGAARQHHVVALAVQLDDLEFQGLAFERGGVLDRTGVDQRTRQEGTDAVGQNGQAALDLAIDGTGDDLAGLHRLFQREPRCQTLGLVARQDGVAETVFQGFDRNGDEVADVDFDFAVVVLEFFNRDEGFGLQAGVDDHEVVIQAHDFCRDDFTRTHVLTRQRFFEQSSKFAGGINTCSDNGSGRHKRK